MMKFLKIFSLISVLFPLYLGAVTTEVSFGSLASHSTYWMAFDESHSNNVNLTYYASDDYAKVLNAYLYSEKFRPKKCLNYIELTVGWSSASQKCDLCVEGAQSLQINNKTEWNKPIGNVTYDASASANGWKTIRFDMTNLEYDFEHATHSLFLRIYPVNNYSTKSVAFLIKSIKLVYDDETIVVKDVNTNLGAALSTAKTGDKIKIMQELTGVFALENDSLLIAATNPGECSFPSLGKTDSENFHQSDWVKIKVKDAADYENRLFDPGQTFTVADGKLLVPDTETLSYNSSIELSRDKNIYRIENFTDTENHVAPQNLECALIEGKIAVSEGTPFLTSDNGAASIAIDDRYNLLNTAPVNKTIQFTSLIEKSDVSTSPSIQMSAGNANYTIVPLSSYKEVTTSVSDTELGKTVVSTRYFLPTGIEIDAAASRHYTGIILKVENYSDGKSLTTKTTRF